MNMAQAKQIYLRGLLENLGHKPGRENKGECWYLSLRLDSSHHHNPTQQSLWHEQRSAVPAISLYKLYCRDGYSYMYI